MLALRMPDLCPKTAHAHSKEQPGWSERALLVSPVLRTSTLSAHLRPASPNSHRKFPKNLHRKNGSSPTPHGKFPKFFHLQAQIHTV
jgi:hypothetical protein